MIDDIIQADFIEWSEKNAMTSKNFDLVIGNPPFSDASSKAKNRTNQGMTKLLYPIFFSKALKLSNILVAMIMPKTNVHLKESVHNKTLREQATLIKDIPEDAFSTIQFPVWYVIVDKNAATKDPSLNEIEWYSDIQQNNTIDFQRGKLSITDYRPLLTNDKSPINPDTDIEVYHKISKTSGLLKYYCSQYDIPLNKRFPSNGYAVLLPGTIGPNGWSQVEIVKCNGRQAGMTGLNIAFVNTKEEAEKLVDVMKTKDFVNQVVKYTGLMGGIRPRALKTATISL